jgi:predicted kinase
VDVTQLESDVLRLTESLGHLGEPVVNPVFIIISGLPGTGKSYFSNKLAEKLSIIVLESDALRKILFPSPTYTLEESTRLFQTIHLLLEKLLKKGISVILDATNLSERHRQRLYNITDRLNVKLILVRVEAPPAVVQERLKAREKGLVQSKSEAGWDVYERMQPTVEKIRRTHYAVDTSRDIAPVLNKIAREVIK